MPRHPPPPSTGPAVVATHHLSKLAVKLESSWRVRRTPGDEHRSEVAVEIHRPIEPA